MSHKVNDLLNQKEEFSRRTADMDQLKSEIARLRHYEADNKKLMDQKRDDDFRISQLRDKTNDLERINMTLKKQTSENDTMIAQFTEEIRKLDLQTERRQRD